MQRFGRVGRLRAGAEAEYERQHANVWPEVLEATKRAGVHNYTIFRYGQWLFSYFEMAEGCSLDDLGEAVETDEACQRWEELMRDLVEPLAESGDQIWWVPMKEVWHLPD